MVTTIVVLETVVNGNRAIVVLETVAMVTGQ